MHKIKKLLIIILISSSIIAFAIGADHIKQNIFELITQQRNALLLIIENNPITSYSILFILTTILVTTPIPLAAVAKVIGGLVFGVFYGTLFNIIATTIGCIIGYGIGKYAIPKSFYEKYRSKIKKIDNEFQNNGFLYLMILRLSIVFPFFLINLISGPSKKISFSKYLLSTIISIIPTSFIYAYAGSQFATLNSFSEIFSLEILVLLLVIILFIITIILLKKYTIKKKNITF